MYLFNSALYMRQQSSSYGVYEEVTDIAGAGCTDGLEPTGAD